MTSRLILLVLYVVAMTACGPAPTMAAPEEAQSRTRAESERFVVERADVFRDALAYDGKRGIYVIRDKQTGREFIGVSGVGVAEIGSHSCGKSCVAEDER